MTAYSNWGPIVAHAWAAISEEDYARYHEKGGTAGVNEHGNRDCFTLKNAHLTFQPTAEYAIQNAKLLLAEKKKPLICKLGFSELTCVNAINCAMYGDTMDIMVVVMEKLTYEG